MTLLSYVTEEWKWLFLMHEKLYIRTRTLSLCPYGLLRGRDDVMEEWGKSAGEWSPT